MAWDKRRFFSFLFVICAISGSRIVFSKPPKAPSVVSASSQKVQTAHITASYKENGAEITKTYAVSQETLRAEQIWAAQQPTPPSGEQVAGWLDSHGALLDRQDGPAFTERNADGSRYEAYWHNGKLDRQDGPAITARKADGSPTLEVYWHNGRCDRRDGPAIVWNFADGSTYEAYYRDGLLDRKDGPAITTRKADGTTTEDYYRKGEQDREDGPASILLCASGPTEEKYYHHGLLDRRDGPAIIWRNARDEITEESFYRNGRFIKEVCPLQPRSDSAAKAQPVGPKAADSHRTPGPA